MHEKEKETFGLAQMKNKVYFKDKEKSHGNSESEELPQDRQVSTFHESKELHSTR